MSQASKPADQWSADIASLLEDLTGIQEEILTTLEAKRASILAHDLAGLEQLQQQEASLGEQLAECHGRRGKLLADATESGLNGDSLESLSKCVSDSDNGNLTKRVKATSQRMRLMQHGSLTNWVVTQRTLLHLSQILEIIGTKGRLRATYGDTNVDNSGGALMDQEV